ncbi:MAG TPA: hypothetical protein VNF49_01000, partial [Candidatus Binataceae bacterium]|nr:hypothetical protein [Candidatus Binataceae bacterium]
FLDSLTLSARCAATCDCVIIILLVRERVSQTEGEPAPRHLQAATGAKPAFFLRTVTVFQQLPL